MARALYYPPASQTAQWFNDDYRGAGIEPNVTVWHTTETGHWPGYGGGASAPHLTYHAEDHEWRQHFRLDRSSRALRNEAGGVETNTLNACQVEIIAYSDESLARSRGHLPVSELDDQALRDLGDFAAFMHDEWGMRLDIDPGWVRSNYRNPRRMSGSQWRNFYGHTGHNRVPENTHWDPARLDIDTIIAHARGGAGGGTDMSWSEQINHSSWTHSIGGSWEDEDSKSARSWLRSAAGHALLGEWAARDNGKALDKLGEQMAALAAAQSGEDVVAAIEAHHAERKAEIEALASASAERDGAILTAVEQVDSGEVTAAEALRQLAALIQAEIPADA